MTDIIEEVLNDEKYEKRLLIFRKALPIIITFAVAIAIAISLYSWYKHKEIEHNREIGDIFVQLIAGEYKDNVNPASALEDLAKNADNRQEEFAELKVANLLIVAKDYESALKKLEEIISNKNYSEITTSLARIFWVNIVLDKSKIPDELQMQTRSYLQHFSDQDQPFFAVATLMKALFYKKVGQNDLASEYANVVLKLDDASLILKEQARAILSSIQLNLSIKS